jgi:AsmA protein
MRALKIVGMVVGGLVALMALCLVAIWLFFDPNDYKDRITAVVRESTGRTLLLPGKLKLSVFPWIAVETGEASLGNPRGFGDEPFLTLKRASLSVKLLPLLHKQLEVGRVEIDGLDLKLKQNAAGKGNWEDWGAPDSSSPSSSSGPTNLNLAGVRIADARLAFEDMVAQKTNITIGRIAPGAAIPMEMKMELVSKAGARPMPLSAGFELQLDLDKQQYRLSKLALRGNMQPEGAPKALDWQFDSPAVELDLAAQSMAQTTFSAQFGAAKLGGAITGSKLIDAPALNGSFELAELAPRELMAQLGITPPVTRDKSALARFGAKGRYAWQGTVARMSDLSLTLDESKLSGRFAYDTASSGMDFAMNLDRIDLDRYQPPPVNPDEKSEPIELPVKLLKPMRAKGSFNVGQIKVGGAHLTDLSAGIDIGNAQARFAPLTAKLYGGSYRGDIQLDMRPAVARLSMDEHLVGIDIAVLMKEYADSQRLSGRGNLDAKLVASGSNGDALLKTLTGTIGLNLRDGAVEGIDVWYAIAQAQSLIQKHQLAAATNSKRTAFDSFRATADVVNGVATTKDLNIASQLLQITGAGSTNLVAQSLDYTITATVLKAPPNADAGTAQLERARIPVKITGTFADPKIRPDLAGMAKERVKQEVEKRKDEVQEKVKEKVKDKLKGLFGR